MFKLLFLCLGATVLMALSQRDNPSRQVQWGPARHYIRRRSDVFMAIAIVWIAGFAFLRTNYNDTAAYIRGFRDAQPFLQGLSSGAYSDWMENPLSSAYRDLMAGITDNYHVYFLLPALLHSVALVKLFKHYSVSPSISMLLYFCLGTYVMLFLAAFKQGMAMAILLLALPYAERKNYVTYVLLVLLATLFHFFAIVYLVVPLLFGKPWGITTWALVAVAVFTLFTYESTLGALMTNVEEMAGNIAEEELFDGNSINVLRVAVYWVPGLLALLFRKHVNYHSTRIDNLFVNLSVLCASILTIGLAEGANLYARMAGYFEIALAFSLPYIIRKVFTKESATLVNGLAIVLFLGYFYYEFTFSKNFAGDYRSITLVRFLLELMGLV